VDKTTPAAIQISTNYGTTFHSVAGTELFNYHASGISGSGQYMFASNYTTHYFSTDFGNTFNLLTNLPEKYYYSCFTSNYNGQYILLVSDHGNYLSTDYGVTFNVSPYPVGKTAFSDSGEFMVVATANVGVYLSNNYGNTWILSTAPAKNWVILQSRRMVNELLYVNIEAIFISPVILGKHGIYILLRFNNNFFS
jgi:hypothetical protein